MTAFEDLHAKYVRGDKLSDQELDSLTGSVGEFAAMAREAETIFGRGVVNYLTLLESNLTGLMRDRARLAAEPARAPAPGR